MRSGKARAKGYDDDTNPSSGREESFNNEDKSKEEKKDMSSSQNDDTSTTTTANKAKGRDLKVVNLVDDVAKGMCIDMIHVLTTYYLTFVFVSYIFLPSPLPYFQ